ncbi:MAG TPA: hypothetical protein VJ792_09240 [Candidatus Nitrosotalea sp.]|nr:hypothetical protein [Candidatus Nitrosotalea sp.]
MKFASISPFIAVIILGIAVFAGHPMLDRSVDMTQWKANQQILLLIENCQDGHMSASSCKEQLPTVLDQCRSFHVLACDDDRLAGLLNPGHNRVGME